MRDIRCSSPFILVILILANAGEVKDEPFAIKQTDQIVGMIVHLIESALGCHTSAVYFVAMKNSATSRMRCREGRKTVWSG